MAGRACGVCVRALQSQGERETTREGLTAGSGDAEVSGRPARLTGSEETAEEGAAAD